MSYRDEEHVAEGDVRTNIIENVWSLLKRSIIGSYYQVSAKRLDAYLDELEFRFNNCDSSCMIRDAMLKSVVADNLPYQKLIEE